MKNELTLSRADSQNVIDSEIENHYSVISPSLVGFTSESSLAIFYQFMGSIIGFESTCDDTGVSIVDKDGTILSNELESQMRRHLWNGGIIPMVAKDLHIEAIDSVANKAFEKSKLISFKQEIDAISVANRPGLSQSIQVGLNYAKTLAKKYKKPLIPIHHMQAHALMPLLEHRQIRFPFITLLISGGHCLLAVAKRFDEFHIVGQTLDDAPGDTLDKFARRLRLRNLGPPFDNMSGGASIEMLARGGDRFRYFNTETAVPKFKRSSCDFSFSGYRGAYETLTPMIDQLWLSDRRDHLIKELSDMCASLQRIFLIQLVKRLHRSLTYFRMYWRYQNEDAFSNNNTSEHLGFGLHDIDFQEGTDSVDLVISGGVAANSYFVDTIRKICRESSELNLRVYAPSRGLANDNGLMIAWNGLLHYRNHIRCPESSIVIDNVRAMDKVDAVAQSPIGQDLRDHVKLHGFSMKSLKHPELKIG